MRFFVHVYEPGINPGGYYDIFEVEVKNDKDAERIAEQQARSRWPDNTGLMVWKTEV